MSEPVDVEPTTTTSRRRERSDAVANRQKLLAVARHLFATQGVENTDMCEVARAAGVGQGTLYRHFANRGELCQALIRDDLDAFIARIEPMLTVPGDSTSPLDRLDALLVAQIRLVDQHLPLLAALEDGGGPPHPKHRRSPWHNWLRSHLCRLLTIAQDRGEIRADLDVEYLADSVLAVVSPRHIGHQRSDLGYSLDRIIVGARRLFLESLGAGRG